MCVDVRVSQEGAVGEDPTMILHCILKQIEDPETPQAMLESCVSILQVYAMEGQWSGEMGMRGSCLQSHTAGGVIKELIQLGALNSIAFALCQNISAAELVLDLVDSLIWLTEVGECCYGKFSENMSQ